MTGNFGAVPLTPERWQRIEAIFHAAVPLPEAERDEYVRANCGCDDLLFAEIQRMVSAFDEERQRQTSVCVEPETARAGVRLGEYVIDREIGHGGMGTVYLGHRADGQFEQRVALKVVSAHLRSQFFTERFRLERQILAQLNHPNITRLLDGGLSAEAEPYLAMEYVDGSPINRYCDERTLPVVERIRLFLQVCSAVECAHRNLIVHRDLKPGNVFVTGAGVPKLLDFGTAKLLLLATEDSTTTRFGMMTPRYASPEQLRGEPVTTLTDVYSLGVMLYELLTGAWPFGDPDSPIVGLERAVRPMEPARPAQAITGESARLRSESRSRLVRLLEGDLRNVIVRAIEADPGRRYPSVEQFAEDLRRCLDGKPVLARAQTWPYRVNRFVRRHWIPVSVAGVLAAGLSAATAVAIREARVARAEVAKAEAVTRVLQDVIYAGDPDDVKNRTILEAMDIARARLNDVKDQPDVELSIRVALGYVYMQNSLLPQAEKELRRAETLARQTGNDEMLASALLSLGNVLYDSTQVRATFMEALRMERSKGREWPAQLRVGLLSEIGQFLGIEKHAPEVEQMLREAAQLARTNPMPAGSKVVALSRLGQYLRYENRLDEAEAVLQEALGLVSARPSVSSDLALAELGAIHIKRGDLEGGERYYRQRRDLLMSLEGPGNGTAMDSRSRWASLMARTGRLREALQEMRDNMVYCRKAFVAGSLGLWHPTATLAYILNQSDQPAEALSLAKESLQCLGKTDPSDLRLAMAEAEAGIALAKLGRNAEALPYLQDSFRIYSADPSVGPADYRTGRIRTYLGRGDTKVVYTRQ